MSSTPMKSTANPFGIETDMQCRTSLEQDGSGGEAYAGTFSGLVRIGGRRDRVEKKAFLPAEYESPASVVSGER